MLRRSFTALLTAALVAAPGATAVAQTTDEATDEATSTVVTEPALTALADLVDAIAAAMGLDPTASGTDPSVSEDDADGAREAWAELLNQALEGIKVHSLVTKGDAAAADDGDDEGESSELTTEDAEAGEDHGEIVRTIAHCAPRGAGMRGLFDAIRNHGALVSAAATGGSVTLAVPVLQGEGTDATVDTEAEPTTVVHELTSVAAAEALCADLETIQVASELQRELADQTTEDDADEDRKADRKADRDAAKAERRAEREDRKSEREAAREERKRDRGQGRDDHPGRGSARR